MIRAVLTIAFLFLASAAHAAPVDIVYGPGTFIISSPITYSSNDQFSLRCAGRDRTTLIWTGTGTMIDVTYTEMSKPPRIEGCTILTRGYATDTAISLNGPTTGGTAFDLPHLTDLTIRGENPLTQVWQRAIKLNNVWHPIVSSVFITGLGNSAVWGTPPYPLLSCLEFSRTQVLDLTDFHCFYAQDGVLQTDAELGEGQIIHHFDLVGVNRGIVLRSMGGTAISDGHIQCWELCIDLDGKLQISIHDNLILRWPVSTAAVWTAIRVLNGQSVTIRGNGIYGNPGATGQNNGVYFVSVTDSNVIGNIFGWFNAVGAKYPIILGTASTRNIVAENQAMNNCGAGGGAGSCGAIVTIGGGVVGNWTNFNKP